MRYTTLHKLYLYFVAACASIGLSAIPTQAAPCPVPATPPSHAGGIAKIIHNIGSNLTGSDLAAARTAAAGQAASNGISLGYHSTARCDFQRFGGKYTPPALPADKVGKFVYGLAIFSDDGSSVKVNGQQIFSRYSKLQGLPDTANSFSVLPIVLEPGVEADFVVDYSNMIYTGNQDIDGCILFLYLVPKLPIVFVTPAGDPVASPVDAGNDPAAIPDGANEFTYSIAAPGVLKVKLKAELPDLDSMPSAEKAKFTFEIDGIGTSTFKWDAANPAGKPEISGDILTATATYTGLPRHNKDFGLKKARIMYDGAFVKEEDFEVFFPIKDAAGAFVSNHPGGQMDVWDSAARKLNPGTVPNFYYYWRQLPEASGVNLAYGGMGINGAVPAITDWGYDRQIDKTLVLIGEDSYVADEAYGVGEFVSGIDWFGNTLIHEGRHVWQVSEFDKLVPTGTANSPWEIGWAFNQGSNHNHWTLGSDGKPGEGGVDDDADGNVDNLLTSGPGELGKFNPATALADRDENLTHPNLVIQTWQNWPAAIPYPDPMIHPTWEIESDAINHANDNYDEHQNARIDWGNPGKNHQTVDKWND